jgi:hypothetical protein
VSASLAISLWPIPRPAIFTLEDGGDMLPLNIGICLQDYTVSQRHAAQLEEVKNQYKVLIGESEVKRPCKIQIVRRIILKRTLI